MMFRRSFADMKAAGRRFRIATHESGHATAARLLMPPGSCGEASIVEGCGWFGYARFPGDHGARSVCAIYAGSVAEALAFGSHDAEGGAFDRALAQELLDELGYSDSGLALWRYTCRLLRPHLPLVTSLALRLEQERTLDGRTIDDIVRRW
jgi:hypothetical protein